MNDDIEFRIAQIAIGLIMFPIGLYHRVRAQVKGERLDRRQEGRFILLTLRPMAIVAALALLGWLINPRWTAWASVPLPAWLRWCGVALLALSGALAFWTFRSLGRNLTDTVVTRNSHTLVTTGPYRWVRHPFYVAFALAVAATGLNTANWFIFATAAAAFMLIVLRTRKEEQNLLARFGEAYRLYMARTGRFFPRR